MRNLIAVSTLILAMCGCAQTPGENKADELDNAAAQSDPAAAAALERRADELRETEPANADAAAQNAMSDAGRVQSGQPPHR